MNQDPFDQMRRNNPVPPDQTPAAPMGVANRILGARASRPGWVIAAAAAAAVVVIGGVSLLLVNRPATTVVADTSTSSVPVASSSPDTTTAAHPATTLGPEDQFAAIIYLFADGVEDTAGSGPYLIPAARGIADNDVAAGTLLALLEGAPADTPALSSAIPEGTTFSDVSVTDGIATVDLSSEFLTGANYVAQERVLAQVVYTLTRLDGVDAVEVLIEGVPNAFEPRLEGGWVTVGPGMRRLRRSEFEHLLPAILIETPAHRATVGNPLRVAGTANVFEASVSLALTDGDGLIIWEGFTTATCGTGCRGDWSVEIPFQVDEPQLGSLIAWEERARDGSQINVREHPVWLLPDEFVVSTTTTSIVGSTCSGGRVEPVLVDQPGLSPENASMRAAIFEAAVMCDWDALRGLQVDGFQYSFGVNGDAIAHWQQLEADGEEPIRFLAELLNRPYGTQPGPGTSEYYSWPSAFVTEWGDISELDREALRPLYDDEDFAVFSDFGGYFGYRVGILDGTWVYFIAGD